MTHSLEGIIGNGGQVMGGLRLGRNKTGLFLVESSSGNHQIWMTFSEVFENNPFCILK